MRRDCSKFPDWPRWMRVEVAADYCGLSASTLRARGPRPFRVGGIPCYDRFDLDKWMEGHKAGEQSPASLASMIEDWRQQ